MPAPPPLPRCPHQPPATIPPMLSTLLSPFKLDPGFRPLFSGSRVFFVFCFPTAIPLSFNLWGGEWCQQNACSRRKPEHSWNLAGTLLVPSLVGPLLFSNLPHANLAGALLELCWNLACNLVGTNLAEISLEYSFLLCLMCRVVMFKGLAWTFLELFCNLTGTYMKTTSGFVLGFVLFLSFF